MGPERQMSCSSINRDQTKWFGLFQPIPNVVDYGGEDWLLSLNINYTQGLMTTPLMDDRFQLPKLKKKHMQYLQTLFLQLNHFALNTFSWFQQLWT